MAVIGLLAVLRVAAAVAVIVKVAVVVALVVTTVLVSTCVVVLSVLLTLKGADSAGVDCAGSVGCSGVGTVSNFPSDGGCFSALASFL